MMRIKFTNYEDGAVLVTRASEDMSKHSTYDLAASVTQSNVALMAMTALGKKHATPASVRKAMLDAIGHLRKQIVDAEIVEDGPT